MTTPSGDPHDLLAGYLLDALDPEEEARFVAHLPTCAVCDAELASLGETVADLAESYHVVPPPTVEARLLSRLFPEENVDPEPAPVTATAERRPRRWVLPAAAAAAFVLGAGAVIGVSALRSSPTVVAASETSDVTTAVMSAPDAHTMPLDLPSGDASIVVSGEMDKAIVMGHELPMPSAGMEYHVWAQSPDGSMSSAGAFVPDSTGAIAMELHGGVRDVASFLITVDPAGAAHPSGVPIAEARL